MYKVPTGWIKNTTTIQAVYSGDETYNTARSNQTGILNITKGTATINLDQDTYTTKSGNTITLKAIVTDETGEIIKSGKVVFKLNGVTLKDSKGNALYAQIKDGIATLTYKVPENYSAKDYTITAVFGGDYYERTESIATLTLEKKDVTIEDLQRSTKSGVTRIKAIILDEDGNKLIRSTKLVVKLNGKTFLSGVNSTDGIINVSFNNTLKAGLYELLIISGENNLYNTGRSTSILRIE